MRFKRLLEGPLQMFDRLRTKAQSLNEGVVSLAATVTVRGNVAAVIVPFRLTHESARSIASSLTRH
jgi:hypothetical protein